MFRRFYPSTIILLSGLLLSGFELSSLPGQRAAAQTIDVTPLATAQAYEAGILNPNNGGLTPELWTSTSAETATALIRQVAPPPHRTLVRDMFRAALLSGGTPPFSDKPQSQIAYQQARLAAIMRLADMQAAQNLIQRVPALGADQYQAANMALIAGDYPQACTIADKVVDARTEDPWIKHRAFCHVIRGELPAAELTVDLLRSRGHDDTIYFSLINILTGVPGKPDLDGLTPEPLYIAMMDQASIPWPSDETRPTVTAARIALSPGLNVDTRLNALFDAGPALSDRQIASVLSDLAAQPSDTALVGGVDNEAPESIALQAAKDSHSPASYGQLYTIAMSGSPTDQTIAAIELLRRAEKAKAFDRFAAFLAPQLSQAPVSLSNIPQADLLLLARAAIQRRDIAALRSVHAALQATPTVQERIALATDAIGNGFIGGGLGTDIETRLNHPDDNISKQAVRDAYIAFAMGANISDQALSQLSQFKEDAKLDTELMALRAAARRRSHAETALRAALILNRSGQVHQIDTLRLLTIIEALQTAGLADFAGRLAAEDFLSALVPSNRDLPPKTHEPRP